MIIPIAFILAIIPLYVTMIAVLACWGVRLVGQSVSIKTRF